MAVFPKNHASVSNNIHNNLPTQLLKQHAYTRIFLCNCVCAYPYIFILGSHISFFICSPRASVSRPRGFHFVSLWCGAHFITGFYYCCLCQCCCYCIYFYFLPVYCKFPGVDPCRVNTPSFNFRFLFHDFPGDSTFAPAHYSHNCFVVVYVVYYTCMRLGWCFYVSALKLCRHNVCYFDCKIKKEKRN